MKKLILNSLTKHPYFPIFLFIVSLLISLGAFIYRDYFESAQTLGLVGLFIINLVSSATFFVSGPAFLTVIAGGSVYNPLLVAFIASLGASIGDLVSFALGHSGRHVALRRLEKHPWFVFIEKVFKKHGFWIIFLFALIPNPLFDAIGLIAGVFRLNWKIFFVLILLGRFTRFIILALIGAKID
ncbi:MAG: VTT domain-containing protein [Candidatus Levybacteria bacterium]|nr:VTT domain-containing protein [Candidatus Levybacteria bacterium]